jgi:hypothetical protein
MDEVGAFPLPMARNGASEAMVMPLGRGRETGRRATFVTIATPDRAAQSRIFARSARRCHPDARLVVLILEWDGPPRMFEDLYDLVIPAEQLSLGGLADMRFRYATAELCFALKAWVIRHLLEKFPDEVICYFDSNIELFTPLAEVEAALAHGANLVLTPHIVRPAADQDSEMALLRAGSLNAGFLAVAPTAAARAFVAWWCDRVRTGCTGDRSGDNHGDQKWLELASSICDGVTVLRHPGYNFAYWNACERKLSCRGGVWEAAGWPLRFVHYSQWNWREQDCGQYLARYFRGEYQQFAGLFADYQKQLRAERDVAEARAPRVYGEVLAPCGTPVPDLLRRAYERHGPAVDGDASEVFARAVCILNAPSPTRADLPGLPITLLYDEIWEHHADLRYRFDVDRADGRLAFLQWLADRAVAELGIPAAFMAPARSALEGEQRRLEPGGAVAVPLPSTADPGLPATPDTPAAATISGLIAARDAVRERTRRQDGDIRMLVDSNKALRRAGQALLVQSRRDEETIRALETELTQTRRAHHRANRRSRLLADEAVSLRRRAWYRAAWHKLAERPGARSRSKETEFAGRPALAGDGPFFQRGFLLGDGAEISGTTVKRGKDAPAGMLIFGPYVALPTGVYAVSLDARLYQALPLLTSFKLDVVCDQSRQIVGLRWYRLHPFAGWRRFRLIFTVCEGDDYPDFEMRIWARKGTPLEIGRIELHRLTGEPPVASAAPPDAAGDASP